MMLVKLILVFGVVVVLLMRRVNLGAVMAAASCLLGLLFGLSPAGFGSVLLTTFTSAGNLYLLMALTMIMLLETILQQEGSLRRMVNALRHLVGNPRMAAASLPALVGLLPSAGGAIFSAPMVGELLEGSDATAENKSFINYWYRHIWECATPISLNVLLVIQVFERQAATVLPYLLPTIPIAALAGWATAFGGLHLHAGGPVNGEHRRHLRDLAAGLLPILTVLVLVLLFQFETAIACALVVLGLLLWHRLGPAQWPSLIRKAIAWDILLAMAAVLLFKEVLVATRAVATLAPLLTAASLPMISLFILLPFLVGLATGAPQAFVGTAAPLLVGLLGGQTASPALVALVIVSGYGGVMLSPLHMCLVLTVSYFQADLAKVYRMVLVPELVLVGVSIAYLSLF